MNPAEVVQELVKKHVQVTGQMPSKLYTGRAELAAIRLFSKQFPTTEIIPKANKEMFMGLQIVEVKDTTFLEVGVSIS